MLQKKWAKLTFLLPLLLSLFLSFTLSLPTFAATQKAASSHTDATRLSYHVALHPMYGPSEETQITSSPLGLPLVGCHNFVCDNMDPVATHCDGPQTLTIATVYFATGYLELRWSPECETNWTRVTSTVGPADIHAEVKRSYPAPQGDASVEYIGATSVYSDMLYGYVYPVTAIGSVNGVGAYFAQ